MSLFCVTSAGWLFARFPVEDISIGELKPRASSSCNSSLVLLLHCGVHRHLLHSFSLPHLAHLIDFIPLHCFFPQVQIRCCAALARAQGGMHAAPVRRRALPAVQVSLSDFWPDGSSGSCGDSCDPHMPHSSRRQHGTSPGVRTRPSPLNCPINLFHAWCLGC